MTRSGKSNIIAELAPYLSLGTQMTATIAVLGFVGWFLDSQFESSPLWTIVGLVVGSIAGLYGFLRQVSVLQRKRDKTRERR